MTEEQVALAINMINRTEAFIKRVHGTDEESRKCISSARLELCFLKKVVKGIYKPKEITR